MNLISSLS
jgi:hypothetical protein